MKPAFDQLGDEYASSSSVAIMDVDCTVHQDLCSKVLVDPLPCPDQSLIGASVAMMITL